MPDYLHRRFRQRSPAPWLSLPARAAAFLESLPLVKRYLERVAVTTTDTGTGSLTLGSAITGARTFGSAVSNGEITDGDTVDYLIQDEATWDWEIGTGTYNSGSLTRTTVHVSTNSNTQVDFAAGTKKVYVILSAQRITQFDTAITELNGIATLASTGLIARTGTATAAVRTIGATSPIAISNGNGVSGNPALTFDQTGLSTADAAFSNTVVGYSSGNKAFQIDRLLALLRMSPGGRLTLSSTDPTGESASASTLYYLPYIHDMICLWDGTRWVWVTFSSISLSLSSLTSGKNYDVFCYLSSGTPTLESLVWTDDTTRATAVTFQDGRLCKSGDKTRLLLGTFRSISTTQTAHTNGQRFVSNVYNRTIAHNTITDATSSWTQTTASWRQARSTAANKIEYVEALPAGSDTPVEGIVAASGFNGGAAIVGAAVGVDSTSTPSGLYGGPVTANGVTLYGVYRGKPGTGFHTLYWLEYGNASTMTWYGTNSPALSGITATMEC